MVVDVGTQHHGPQRAHQIARTKGHERQHQRGVLVLRWEKRAPDGRGIIAEDHEVIHLQEISRSDANDRANT